MQQTARNVKPISTPPWQHQREAFLFSKNKKGCLLGMDMGTGKTLVAICHTVRSNRTLVVCPKSVIPTWENEIRKHVRKSHQPTVLLLNKGNSKQKAENLNQQIRVSIAKSQPLVAVINYESVWREPIAKVTRLYSWDLIIADESHRIKSPAGVASRFMSRLGKNADIRLGLTGTPMPHSFADIYAQYRFLDPSIFGYSYAKFKKRYAQMGGYENRQIKGIKNKKEFQRKFNSIAFQVSSDDVLDLPDRQHIERTFWLSESAAEIYSNLEKRFYTQVKEGQLTVMNALSKLLRLQQLTGGHLPDDDGQIHEVDSGKKELLKDILEDFPPDEPIVVFARFKADINSIISAAKDSGRKVGELSGRADDLEKFKDRKVHVLATQIRSGGVGVDLSRARYCIFYSLGFSLGDYEQALKRVHRPGQTRKVFYIHLISENTVDRKVYHALAKRKQVVEEILKGGENNGKS